MTDELKSTARLLASGCILAGMLSAMPGGARADVAGYIHPRVGQERVDEPAPIVKFANVTIRGNQPEFTARLKRIVWLSLEKLPMFVIFPPVESFRDRPEDAELPAKSEVTSLIKLNMERFYRQRGYLDAEVHSTVETGQINRLRFNIKEGDRYRVSEVKLKGSIESVDRSAVWSAIRVHAGQFYSPKALERDKHLIEDLIGNKGRCARVREEIFWQGTDRPGQVFVRYEVQESEPMKVGQIRVKGNVKTSRDTILKHVHLRPGDLLRFPELRKAERRLARTGKFVVNPEAGIRPYVDVLDLESDNPVKDILVTVQEPE